MDTSQFTTAVQKKNHSIEVSAHMARVWQLLRSTSQWLSNADIAKQAQVAPRSARHYTRVWLDLRLVERMEVFPHHLYRLAPEAQRQQARLWEHLENCTQVLLSRGE